MFGKVIIYNFPDISENSIRKLVRRCGREVEGTPLLREHTGKTRIEGSNPSISANQYFKELQRTSKNPNKSVT